MSLWLKRSLSSADKNGGSKRKHYMRKKTCLKGSSSGQMGAISGWRGKTEMAARHRHRSWERKCRMSQKSERKAWSTLAAETHVKQHALDRVTGMKTLITEIGLKIAATKVLTDILSLKKMLYRCQLNRSFWNQL